MTEFDQTIQWENRLQTLREKSIAEINFSDALATVITNEEFRALTDEQQRELIQAWLYPTNDNDEITENSDNKETLIELFQRIVPHFQSYVFCPTCSNCFQREAAIVVISDTGTPFEFCRICYDQLKREYVKRDVEMTHCI